LAQRKTPGGGAERLGISVRNLAGYGGRGACLHIQRETMTEVPNGYGAITVGGSWCRVYGHRHRNRVLDGEADMTEIKIGRFEAEFDGGGYPVFVRVRFAEGEFFTFRHNEIRDLHQLLGLVRERVQPLLQPNDRHEG
jgi:hypothetical protein